jgi:hypothetical protein
VESLSFAGQQAEAEKLLRGLETNILINSQDALPFARTWQRWGDRNEARAKYAEALPENTVFFQDDQAEYLIQIIRGGDLGLARDRLRRFYRSGGSTGFTPLLEYLKAAGRLGPETRLEPDVAFAGLSERLRVSWRAALLEHAVTNSNAELARALAQSYGDQVLQKPGLADQVLALAPDTTRALRYQAAFQMERGHATEARAFLERALAATPPASTEDLKAIRKELDALPKP